MHTLLLADDSVTIQRVIELTFADEDIRVVAVSDGGEAIALLDQAPPDIVLADVGMPGQNGYEVARHIRNTPRLAHIPIVLLTGAFEPIDQARMAEVGCDGVLAKPFEPQLVIARVKELLARPKDMASAVPAAEKKEAPASVEPEPASREAESASREAEAASREAEPASREELDGYFDRLDAAFSNLPMSSGPAHQASSPAEPPPTSDDDWMDGPTRAMTSTMSDGTSDRSDDAPFVDLPLSRSAAGDRPRELPQASPAPSPPAFPPLADAFAALLAAEQAGPAPLKVPAWPVTAGPGWISTFQSPAPTLPDDFAEQVTRRVLDQLSDRVVRETTAEIVSAVAERLVKEEIERIKRHISS